MLLELDSNLKEHVSLGTTTNRLVMGVEKKNNGDDKLTCDRGKRVNATRKRTAGKQRFRSCKKVKLVIWNSSVAQPGSRMAYPFGLTGHGHRRGKGGVGWWCVGLYLLSLQYIIPSMILLNSLLRDDHDVL